MSTPNRAYFIRLATIADTPALARLIEDSVRGLQNRDYSVAQMEGALGTVFGVDTQLIADGTYYAAEAVGGALAGCGGWSRRRTLFGSDRNPGREDALLDPARDAAKIRAFFVHPEWARRGIASEILKTCEEAAQREGFTRFEMGATLTGVPMYAARGYIEMERIVVALANGASLPIVRMSKTI